MNSYLNVSCWLGPRKRLDVRNENSLICIKVEDHGNGFDYNAVRAMQGNGSGFGLFNFFSIARLCLSTAAKNDGSLVVDDDNSILKYVAQMLDRLGCQVDTAQEKPEVMNKVTTGTYNLLVTEGMYDFTLPLDRYHEIQYQMDAIFSSLEKP